ncbi:MAG: hypothetical protein NWR73_07885 [Flavobacteriales bacterium]|jgi:regulator of replication initiation timing|nr:hypothetical protein [Flavobacteriales bacterium]
MTDITQLNQERQRLMQVFLKVKAELAAMKEENDALKKENSELSENLAIRETELQNLFSYLGDQGLLN